MILWIFVFTWRPEGYDKKKAGAVRWYDRWIVVTPWPDEASRLKSMGGILVKEIEI